MKRVVLTFTAVLLAATVFAQTSNFQNEEEIELPDVTTVISGGALTAGKDSVPDYKKILPEADAGSVEFPAMDEAGGYSAPQAAYVPQGAGEQSVFAEGEIGGGFPFSFTGNFSVYRTTGDSPFEISFFHKNNEGLVKEAASDGYYSRQTGIDAEKNWYRDSSKYKISGWYYNSNDGFQGLSESFTDYLWNDIGGVASAEWNLKKGWFINTSVLAAFYDRWGTTYNGASDTAFAFEDSAKLLKVSPDFSFGWKNDAFNVNFLAKYATQLNLKDTGTLEKAPDSTSAEAGHKGKAQLNFEWTDDTVKVWANAAVTGGTHTGSQKVLFPFTLGASFSSFYPLSSRPFALSAEGGCRSQWHYADTTEENSPFAVLSCLPGEQTDWYGQLDVSMPIKDMFSLGVNAEFKKTAFGNGVWAPDYLDDDSRLAGGYYVIKQIERTELNTGADFTMDFKLVKLTGNWKAYWMDVPSFKDKQSLTAGILFQSENSKWNAGATVTEYLGKNADTVPDLGVTASLKASNAIRLALKATDIIKLCTGKNRDFAHSVYKQSSSNISALIKFQF